jgi:hypothetical protein
MLHYLMALQREQEAQQQRESPQQQTQQQQHHQLQQHHQQQQHHQLQQNLQRQEQFNQREHLQQFLLLQHHFQQQEQHEQQQRQQQQQQEQTQRMEQLQQIFLLQQQQQQQQQQQKMLHQQQQQQKQQRQIQQEQLQLQLHQQRQEKEQEQRQREPQVERSAWLPSPPTFASLLPFYPYIAGNGQAMYARPQASAHADYLFSSLKYQQGQEALNRGQQQPVSSGWHQTETEDSRHHAPVEGKQPEEDRRQQGERGNSLKCDLTPSGETVDAELAKVNGNRREAGTGDYQQAFRKREPDSDEPVRLDKAFGTWGQPLEPVEEDKRPSDEHQKDDQGIDAVEKYRRPTVEDQKPRTDFGAPKDTARAFDFQTKCERNFDGHENRFPEPADEQNILRNLHGADSGIRNLHGADSGTRNLHGADSGIRNLHGADSGTRNQHGADSGTRNLHGADSGTRNLHGADSETRTDR